MPSKRPERPEAAPLYYAILCGFRWLIEHPIVTHPEDADARGGYYGTPLLTAISRKEDGNTTLSPPQHGADINLPDEEGKTPLNSVPQRGELEISQLLVERGADVHSRNKTGWTPLKKASHFGRLDVVQLLIDSGADVNSRGDDGWTPFFLIHVYSGMRIGDTDQSQQIQAVFMKHIRP
ncbi:ankyrin repeat-containing domain protein [Lactarius vividus]|nr:ankyrin repeat-containing domain protein [Lactarius vividus]